MAQRQFFAPLCGTLLALCCATACGTDPALDAGGSGSASAEAPPVSAERINGLVDAYLIAGGSKAFLRNHKDHCGPGGGWPQPDAQGCAEAACKHMDTWDCDDQSEVLAILQACKGNYGGGCVDTTCNRMDTWDCDDASEIIPIAKACAGVVDTSCLSTVCNRMDQWDCDDVSEVLPIINACHAGVDSSCVDFVCNQLDAWDCDDWSEIEKILDSCAGSDHH